MTYACRSGPAAVRALAASLPPLCKHPRRGWRRFPLVERPGGVPVCCSECGRWSVVYPRRRSAP